MGVGCGENHTEPSWKRRAYPNSGDLDVSGNLDVDGTTNMDGATIDSGGLTVTAGGLTVTSGDLTVTAGDLDMDAAASQVVPGATSFSIRNNADSADNLIITDAGLATFIDLLIVTGKLRHP